MNLLILDEPTNHLDIESREALENALMQFNGTIIAVSHDRYFTRRLATRFVDLGENGRDFRGNYDEYLLWLENRSAEKGANPVYAKAAESAQKEEYVNRKRSQAEKRKLEKRQAEIAREIKKLEKELVDIDDLLFGEAATDYIRAAELSDRKITVEDLLMQLYEEDEAVDAELSEWD